MLFPNRLTAAIQLGLASVTVLGQKLDHPAAFKNLDEFGPVLNTLPAATSKISPWLSGNISKGCRDRVLLDKRDPTKFKSYTVHMDDCDIPWIICLEDGAEATIEELVNGFSRLPVGMRQFVGDVVHFKGGVGGTAWQGSIVHVSGESAKTIGVYLHESSHCIDFARGNGMSNEDQVWRDAYNNDTHVADEYAQNNHVENYAQYAGFVIYDRMTDGHLQTYVQYNQLRHQIWAWAAAGDSRQDWGDHMLDYSGKKKCGRRWPLTPAVNPATGEEVCVSKREFYPPLETLGILIEPLPMMIASSTLDLTNCTFV